MVTPVQAVQNVKRLRAAQRYLYADRQRLRSAQEERFQVVMDAALNAKAYRDLYGAEEARPTLADLRDIPMLTRTHLMAYPLDERVGFRQSGMNVHTTGGTSGFPLTTASSEEEESEQELTVARQLLAQGLPASPRPFVVDFARRQSRTEIRVGDRIVHLPVFTSAPEISRAVREQEPKVIMGIPSLLLELASYLEGCVVEGLVTFGEMVDLHTRIELEDRFGVTPVDLYSSTETGHIAWECPSGSGYHINADTVIVEVVDADGRPVADGHIGEIVVTALWNRTCPIIRYRTQDLAVAIHGRCECGVTLPLIGRIEGRTIDWIVGAGGLRVSPVRFLLERFLLESQVSDDYVHRYRITQRAYDDFLVEVQWMNGRNEELVQRIRPFYAELMGGPVDVEVVDVEDITTSGGKFRVVRSLVDR